jgi:hypothetical protein
MRWTDRFSHPQRVTLRCCPRSGPASACGTAALAFGTTCLASRTEDGVRIRCQRVLIYAPTGRAATSAAAFAAGDPIASMDASVAAASATSSLRNVATLGLSTASGRPRR